MSKMVCENPFSGNIQEMEGVGGGGGVKMFLVIGRGMANPQGWRVRIVRVGVRVGIWLPLKNPYP